MSWYLRTSAVSAASILSALVLGLSSSAIAAPIQAYSSAAINSVTSINYVPPNPNFVIDYTGAPVTLNNSSSNFTANGGNVNGYVSWAYGNGSGGYTIKPELDNEYAQASLAAGTLKTNAEFAFGSNGLVSGAPIPLNQTNGDATANASFADSFSTVNSSNGSAFVWSAGDTGTFNFQINGSTSIPSGLTSPDSSLNSVFSDITLELFKPGALELIAESNALDCNGSPTNPTLCDQIGNEINADFISSSFTYLGNPLVPSSYGVTSSEVTALNPSGPTDVNFTVDPGQADFEWIMGLDDFVYVDATEQNVDVVQNFSDTVETSYTGPTGTTTYGAVQFNNVLEAPAAAPEPASLGLLGIGLAGLGAVRRRKA